MLTGLNVKEAAETLAVHEGTVLRRIRRGLLKANKRDGKWQVFLPGRGCSLCEAAGVRTILIQCASCNRYYCRAHSFSACKDGQHGDTVGELQKIYRH